MKTPHFLLLLIAFFLANFTTQVNAQTTLAPGDISFLGINANAPDGIMFVTWVDLSPNTEIRFTDNGFNSTAVSTAAGNYREQEQYVVWKNTTDSTIPAGTKIIITINAASTTTVTNIGTITSVINSSNGTTAVGMSLTNTSGDQVFAFQGAGGSNSNSAAATFTGTIIAGIGYSGSTGTATSWMTTGTINASTSYLPGNLTGNSQIFLGPNVVAGQYSGDTSNQTSLAAYKALVANPANWTKTNVGVVTFKIGTSTSFTAGSPPPAITAQPSTSTICAGATTTFSITATNATSYQWQVDQGAGYANISNAAPYSGATTAILTITAATSILNTYQYRCVVMGSSTPNATSNAATLTVKALPMAAATPASATICSGSATNIALTSTPTEASFAWTAATASGTVNGTSASSGTSISQTLSGNGTTNYTVTPTLNSCVGAPITVAITVSTQGTWLGTSNTAWSNINNWSCGKLPDATTDVVINDGTPYSPLIDNASAACNNLAIGNGANVSFVSAGVLRVNGEITNNGTFDASAGKVQFSGSGQTIPGVTYNDVEITGTGAAKQLDGSATINGVLTLTNTLIQLGTYDLTIGNNGSISGGSSASYLITNSTGTLKINDIGIGGRATSVSFPIGTSNSSYTPVSLTNTGTPDNFSARVISGLNSSYNASDVPDGSVQSSFNVDKTWIVSEATPGGSNATLTFQWNGSDEQPGFNRLSCFASHYYGGSWHQGTSGSSSGSDPYNISLSNITSFSPFGVGSAGSVLPLTLMSFTAKANATTNVLYWTTANEINTASFIIEKSTDGNHFATISSMDVLTKGASIEQQYQFTDTHPEAISYYRLKMTDKDGAYKYSTIVNVTNSGNNASVYTIFPNPVIGAVLYIKPLATVTDRVIVSVSDVAGRKWYTGKIDASSLNSGKAAISVNTLPAGIYLLKIRNEKTGAESSLKFKK